jgi:integral membrane protein (TIGR01906 family)
MKKSCSLLFFICLFSFNILFFIQPSIFQKVYPRLSPNISNEEKRQAQIIAQFLFKRQTFNVQKFAEQRVILTDQEASHMNDVETVMKGVSAILLSSILVLFFILLRQYQMHQLSFDWLSSSLRQASLVSVLSLIIIFLATAFAWQFFFEAFHHIFFPQGNWQFPADSTLIQLFPETFWMKAFALLFLLPNLEIFLLLFMLRLIKESIKQRNATISE